MVAYFCLSKTLVGNLGLASTGMNKEPWKMNLWIQMVAEKTDCLRGLSRNINTNVGWAP
jgi:hypothetical protein